MTYIVNENCIKCKLMDCVDVCPVDCIHPVKEDWEEKGYDEDKLEGKQLYIDPEECIDCGACEPECPVEASFEESEGPEEGHAFTDKNYAYFGQSR